ncbi:MAG TPA: OmpA family protein [Chitinophagaceae bacterium]|nr:OmpA family protein [Chitinophagaceae bacterium]
MRTLIATLVLAGLLAGPAHGQLLKKLSQKVKDKVDQRTDQKEDQTIDKGLDKAEHPTTSGGGNTSGSNGTNTAAAGQDGGGDGSGGNKAPTLISYRNYDFVPGDKIIFQSQLADEQTGEIPSQFDLSNGQMDVQVEDGENVIHVGKGPGAIFTPRMTNQTYMPEQFTVEFDFKNQAMGVGHLHVDFGHRVYYAGGEGITPGITFNGDNTLNWTLGDVTFPEGLDVNSEHAMEWHHVAIAINKTAGKVYIDQYRVANVNNLTGKANNVTFDVNGYENSFIRNIRIAAGGIDIYKEVTTDAKIVTHGILFDVDKATIKPESMGTLNQIASLLKKDPSLKFEIGGHTDNTGNAAHNLALSQQRADAVKAQLVTMGIEDGRLTTKGYGDTKPIDNNTTPEGRANNRRVEFTKQ